MADNHRPFPSSAASDGAGTNAGPDLASVLDRFAPFYDDDYRHYQADLELVLALAEECGDPVLELGCGTGRVLAPLAAHGCQVTGVDISPALLAVARARLAAAGHSVTLVQADLRGLKLQGRPFSFAFCTSNTLMHIADPEGQLDVLRGAHRHLRRQGRLLIDLFNPDIARLIQVDGVVELADHWHSDSGAQVLKWSVRRLDLAEQLQETLFIYEEIAPDGTVRRTACPFTLRFLWRNEAELMLAAAGFELEAVWGDFDASPYGSDSERLILLARKEL